ncbi:MAG: hypothetical protein IPK08_07845 [Bacteroidetes bacterium]|nr:hypothetical protein [Bacteroidota bacterium]
MILILIPILKLDFSSSDGSKFNGPLSLAANGKYYAGTFLEGLPIKELYLNMITQPTIMLKKIELVDTTGFYVFGALIHSKSKIIRTYQAWWCNNLGTLFEYDYVTNTYVKKFDFLIKYPEEIH